MPGSLLSALCLPLVLHLRNVGRIKLDDVTVFGILALVLGWLILLGDMQIYMLCEGRRYWPEAARVWGLRRETKRLQTLFRKAGDEHLSASERKEKQIDLTDGFPTTNAGELEARYPTKLGNLLTSFEEYPRRKYGLDGVFFWPRLWVAIDKDLREELDNAQAIVDGALYLSVSLVIGALVLAVYSGVSAWNPHAIPTLTVSPMTLLFGAVAAAICSRALYLVSLHGQRQYGVLFKALFDQHLEKLAFDDLVEDLAEHFDEPDLMSQTKRRRNMAAWRFLRWHRYRRDGKNILVTDWED